MILPQQGRGGALSGRGQVDLDGHAPTADLNLFKEARRVTEEMLVSLGHVTLSCDFVDYIILDHVISPTGSTDCISSVVGCYKFLSAVSLFVSRYCTITSP